MRLSGRKGKISPRFDADLTLLDDQLNVSMTIAGGDVVYAA